MLWFFAVCLLLLVLFLTFKFYEQRSGGLIMFAGSRRWLDRKLLAIGRSIQRFVLGVLVWMRSLYSRIVARVRATLANWLRSLAALIDFR